MRLLLLNWKHPADPAAGGAERYLLKVAEAWQSQGHEVTLLAPAPGRGDAVIEPGPELRIVGGGRRLAVFSRARRHLAEHMQDYDHVVEFVSTIPFLAHEVTGVAGATAVHHQVADDVWAEEFPPPLNWLGRSWERRRLARMTGARVVAVSPSTAADLDRFGVRTIAVVPPGCDPVPPRERGALTEPRFAFVGRLVRAKRPLDGLAAFEIIRRHTPRASLDVIGSGYLDGRVRRAAGPGVRVHGAVPDAVCETLVAAAHVLLLPATREGWGLVAMEAAAAGVPVVAYDVPGLRDSVVDGRTGILVASSPAAMAEAALALVADPDRWHAMAGAARDHAREHPWSRTADRLMEAITSARKA